MQQGVFQENIDMSVAVPNPAPFGTLVALLAPEQPVSRELAEYLLQFRFGRRDVDRMNELSRKAQCNALSTEKEQELDEYVFVGDMLGILHSKARQRLAEGNDASSS
jgi:hypothetical protein